MKHPSLELLARVVRSKLTREKRLTKLMRDPAEPYSHGWYMCVPQCFNDALDIRLTGRIVSKKKVHIWTQGSWFSFKAGDTIYDTEKAYQPWIEALQAIRLCVQVRAASDVSAKEDGSGRFAGQVTFALSTPDPRRTKIEERFQHTMSQDHFIRFLIGGPSGHLKKQIWDAERGTKQLTLF